MECVSESDYKIKRLRGRKNTSIVHFNWLKPCVPVTRFASTEEDIHSPSEEEIHGLDRNFSSHTPLQQQHIFGRHLELVDETDETVLPPAVSSGECTPESPPQPQTLSR